MIAYLIQEQSLQTGFPSWYRQNLTVEMASSIKALQDLTSLIEKLSDGLVLPTESEIQFICDKVQAFLKIRPKKR